MALRKRPRSPPYGGIHATPPADPSAAIPAPGVAMLALGFMPRHRRRWWELSEASTGRRGPAGGATGQQPPPTPFQGGASRVASGAAGWHYNAPPESAWRCSASVRAGRTDQQ